MATRHALAPYGLLYYLHSLLLFAELHGGAALRGVYVDGVTTGATGAVTDNVCLAVYAYLSAEGQAVMQVGRYGDDAVLCVGTAGGSS